MTWRALRTWSPVKGVCHQRTNVTLFHLSGPVSSQSIVTETEMIAAKDWGGEKGETCLITTAFQFFYISWASQTTLQRARDLFWQFSANQVRVQCQSPRQRGCFAGLVLLGFIQDSLPELRGVRRKIPLGLYPTMHKELGSARDQTRVGLEFQFFKMKRVWRWFYNKVDKLNACQSFT